MNFSHNEASLLPPRIDDVNYVGVIANVDGNSVGRYAHFCRQYNLSYNRVDNIVYEVPDLQTNKYKLFWFTSHIIFPIVVLGLALICANYYYSGLKQPDQVPDFKTVVILLVVSLFLSHAQIIVLIFHLCYLWDFMKLVRRNFDRVPRSEVLSNMINVSAIHNNQQNEFLEISSSAAARFRRREISYDQVKNELAMSRLSINIDVQLEKVTLMVYKDCFVKSNLDSYKKGFDYRICLVVFTISAIFILFKAMIEAIKKL